LHPNEAKSDDEDEGDANADADEDGTGESKSPGQRIMSFFGFTRGASTDSV
jgi:hypothetical protein